MSYHIKIFKKRGKKLIEEIETDLPVYLYVNKWYITLEDKVRLSELIVFYYCISINRDLRECGSIHWKNSKSEGLTPQIKESKLFFLSTCMVFNSSYPIDTKSVEVSSTDGKEEYYFANNKFARNNYLSVFNPYEFTYLGYIPRIWTEF